MDIRKSIEELIGKITSDQALRDRFAKDPVATVEELLGVQLPEEQINQIVDGIKAKLSLDKLGLDKIGGLFKK